MDATIVNSLQAGGPAPKTNPEPGPAGKFMSLLAGYFRVITSILIILLAGLSVSDLVYAQDASLASQMVNLQLTGINVQNNTITGSVTINNNSNKNFGEAYLVIKVISVGGNTTLTANGQQIVIAGPGQSIEFAKSDNFSIVPGQVIEKQISIKYPQAVESGKYKLIVDLKIGDGSSQGITSQEIELTGNSTFLETSASNCQVRVGGIIFNTTEGPIVETNKEAVLVCLVKNSNGQTVQAKPQVFYAINSVSDPTGNVNQLDVPTTLVLGAGNTGTINVNLPKNISPQVYEGVLFFVDNTNQKISPNVPFRWIVPGASAVINNLDLDKSYYKVGETAKVSVSVLPSVDLSWRGGPFPSNPGFKPNAGTDLEKPRLSLKIVNNNNATCGEAGESLPSTKDGIYWKPVEVEVPITAECKNPKVTVEVYEEGVAQPLASLSTSQITVESTPIQENSAVQEKNNLIWWLLGGGLVLLAGGAVGYFLWKKRNKTPPGSTPPLPPLSPPVASLTMLVITIFGLYLMADYSQLFKNPFVVLAQQQFVPFQGVVKTPINNTDTNVANVVFRRNYGGVGPGTDPEEAINVRDFAQNNTGGDSDVVVSPDCTSIKITLQGGSSGAYACYNWAPGMAVASFVDNKAATPSSLISSTGDEIVIPSLQIDRRAFNPLAYTANDGSNFALYGPHIFNVHHFNIYGPRSVSYTLNFPQRLSNGEHTLLVQAAASDTIAHGPNENSVGAPIGRFYSSFEPVDPTLPNINPLPEHNCGGVSPCFINLEHTFSCGPPPVCNQSCATSQECKGEVNGCVDCRPNEQGQNVCQPPPPACNTTCSADRDCFGNKEGCTACVAGSCRVPPACNVACTQDNQCARAADGCTACIDNVCKVPPACGTACTTRAQCSGVKDGCSECLEGTCTDYNDNMCKCDGLTADITYPSNAFNFEAFGKVEGGDIKKADIADITFRMTRDNQVVAKSNPITPQIVENTASKIRFKASWTTPPPAVVRGSTYRVFADVRCKPKKIVASAKENFTPNPNVSVRAPQPKPPLGLRLVKDLADKLFNGHWVGRSIVGDVMAQLASPSPSNAQSNLQLSTLNFVKLLDTDNCRFVMFKFDETLF